MKNRELSINELRRQLFVLRGDWVQRCRWQDQSREDSGSLWNPSRKA